MKIGILTSYFFQEISEIHGKDRIIFGGAEKYLYELCKFLQSEGHKLTVWQPITIPKDIDPPKPFLLKYRRNTRVYRLSACPISTTGHRWERIPN